MKYIFKEYKGNYNKYKFPYLIYLNNEHGESVDNIYKQGFLATRIQNELYYLSRNMRIDLNKFTLTSENRRVLKKNTDLKLQNYSLKKFDFDYSISKMATDFFKAKFGKSIITPQKLKWICTGDFFSDFLIYKNNEETIGYCITMQTETLLHYAYPFYKTELISTNTGMGMMLKAIEYAQEKQKRYVYLGTAYTKNSLYKLQFNGLEWFDGGKWREDIDELKEKIKNEE